MDRTKLVFNFTLAALLLVPMALHAESIAGKRPNIIFILTDDQGYGDISAHGNPILKTANLDKLRSQSMRFTDFHVSPTCSPTRSALLTGRHEFKNGVTHTILERERLTLKSTTLVQLLQSAGYSTGIFGKWHLGDEDEYQPGQRGFSEVFIHGAGGIGQIYPGSCGDAPGNTYFSPMILHNGKFEKTNGYCTDVFFDRATKWIDEQRHEARPFFAYIPLNAPHSPYIAKPEDRAIYDGKGLHPDTQSFFGMIHNIDQNVGTLLAKLDEWDLAKNTLVVFMNDNGGTAGTAVFNAEMRGAKATPWIGGTRASSFWRWPGTIAPADCSALAAHIDFFPTIAEIADATIPDDLKPQIDGRSLAPLLVSPSSNWADRTLMTHLGRWPKFADPNESKFKAGSIRNTRWALVSENGGREPSWQLFDLAVDYGQKNNVLSQHPVVAKELSHEYDLWWQQCLPLMVNEDARGRAINPFQVRYYKQFGGVPTEADLAKMNPQGIIDLEKSRIEELRRKAMSSPGNAEHGKQVFTFEALKCTICHKIDGKGGEVGPDLSLIAGKFDRNHLIEAVLDPSAQILEGYRTTTVVLKDGRTFSGIAIASTKNGFTVIDSANKRTMIANADVEERLFSKISLMPANLTTSLSPTDFADLVAYLETLLAGRRSSPGEGIIGTITVPDGFVVQQVANQLTGCTAMELAPDGRIFVCEQTGSLRIIKDGKLLAEPFVKLPVASTWERGLLGVATDPDFPRTPYVYVCYVSKSPFIHHVVSRFTADGDKAVLNSEFMLLEGDDQEKYVGNFPDGHQGGAIHFGLDRKLYVGIGDQTAGAPAQRFDALLGKILRLNADGSIPEDNPFVQQANGKYQSIWALGLRNPYTFAFQQRTGRMFINDVGGNSEEINEGVSGSDYGWPAIEHGPTFEPRFRGPVHYYPQACISGGAFAPGDLNWSAEYRGKYFFADFKFGAIRILDPNHPAEAKDFAGGLRGPVDLRFGSDGTLYVLLRNAWVVDSAFQSDTGTLAAIRPSAK